MMDDGHLDYRHKSTLEKKHTQGGFAIKGLLNREQDGRMTVASSILSQQRHHKGTLSVLLLVSFMTCSGFVPNTVRDRSTSIVLHGRRDRDIFEDDYYDDDEDDEYFEERRGRRRKSRNKDSEFDDLGEEVYGRQDSGFNVPSSFGRRRGMRLPDSLSKALLAGMFVLGVGLGVTIDSAINTNPRDLASRDAIDQAAPNAGLCAQYGASAMAFDQRVFVSFNPFNVYVSQADVKPACVLRDSNVVPILKDTKLLNDADVRSCKQKMNTWAFVGNLEEKPQLSCVYRSADAQNEFLSDPKLGIGEDYLDDDRAAGKLSSDKVVKGGLTQAQTDTLRKQALQ